MSIKVNDYFSDLFKYRNPNDEAIFDAIKHISCSQFTEDITIISQNFIKEIEYAIFQMRPYKAPGLDEFQPIFF